MQKLSRILVRGLLFLTAMVVVTSQFAPVANAGSLPEPSIQAQSGSISGTVVGSDGNPITGISIGINIENLTGVCTDPSTGQFTFTRLLLDTPYFISAGYEWCGPNDYIIKYWPGVPTLIGAGVPANATPLTLTSSSPNISGINFSLDIGGTISGALYNEATAQPIAGDRITLFVDTGQSILNGACSDPATGQYRMNKLTLNTSYKVVAGLQGCGPHDYLEEYWKDALTFKEATPIRVTKNDPNVSGIDFTLRLKGQTIDYFALGDSIASGHGLMMETDKQCRRSSLAYPNKVADFLKTRYGIVNFKSLACSGATTHDLDKQIGEVLAQLHDDPTLVSITIGVNDFKWYDFDALYKHLQEDKNVYYAWVDQTTANVEQSVQDQVKRLLVHPNVMVILTEYHNPFNTNSLLFQASFFGKGNLLCLQPFDSCYARTEYAVHSLNLALIDIWEKLGQPPRLQIAAVHDAFHGHESPQAGLQMGIKTCGYNTPGIKDTWIQYPTDPQSISNPSLPEELRKLTGPWSGDCFHPNEAGAQAYANAVNADVVRLGY